MFTQVELTNFKSFGDVKFDFRTTDNHSKKFVAIYGENGSGKTNFVSSMRLLTSSITSLASNSRLRKIKDILERTTKDNLNDEDIRNTMRLVLKSEEMLDIFGEYRMIDSDEETTVTYNFVVDGIEGYYTISFKDKLLSEKLYYMLNKKRGILYEISRDDDDSEINKKLKSSVFLNSKCRELIESQIERYWGKHTLLSIIFNEMQETNSQFINNGLSASLLKVIYGFMDVFVLCKNSMGSQYEFRGKLEIKDGKLEKIRVRKDDKRHINQVKVIETVLDNVFTQMYSDIVRVYYEKKSMDNKRWIEYTLFVDKIIAGKIRKVPFEIESAGTQSVLAVLRAILEAVNGHTVIYDEIDSGIHDLLMKRILESIQVEITGQLIITTHNTLLLETANPDNVYIIDVDGDGNKEASCLTDYDFRIQPTHNVRKLYLDGLFGGIPYVDSIDFSVMHNKDMEDDCAKN